MHALDIESFSSHSETYTRSAYVIACTKDEYQLVDNSQVITAKRAASCLVKPDKNDSVMYFKDQNDNCYIMAGLESVNTNSTKLSVDKPLIVESESGDVSFVAKENVNILSNDNLQVFTDGFVVQSKKAKLQIEDLELTTDKIKSNTKSVSLIASNITTVAETITQRCKSSFRFIEKLDQLKAGSMMQKVHNLFSSQSRQAVILAEEDVKVDAKRIHMG